MWTAGTGAIGLDARWPTPIVSKIVTAFSNPGDTVVLLPWPTPQSRPGQLARHSVVGAHGVIDHAPGSDPNDEVAEALATVQGLDRTARVVRLAAEDGAAAAASRPFWADLLNSPDRTAGITSTPTAPGTTSTVPEEVATAQAEVDLIITSLPPEHSGDHTGDLIARAAARLLRVGGILAVLTHSDTPAGELLDPTGAAVAAAQNADLLYLQHIVALHLPVRGGRFATDLLAELDGAAAEHHVRAGHRAAVRGLPTPHRRIHSDVLVFAQPHEHEPLSVSPAEQANRSGVIR